MSDSGAANGYGEREQATPQLSDRARLFVIVLLVGAGYYVGALLGKSLRFPGSHLSLIWPPTAILMAALLLVPLRKWWIVLLAIAPIHVGVQLQDNVPGWGVISQLIGNFSQASLAAFVVRYFNKGSAPFESFRSLVVFMLGAVIFAPVLVSSIAAYLYVLSGWEQSYGYAWGARVLSNALSTLMIVPPIILLATRRATAEKVSATLARYVEAGLLIVALVLIGWISFSQEGEALFGMTCPIVLPLPVLLWSAVRFRLQGLCLAVLLVAYFAFLSTTRGQGFFAMNSPAQNMLSLQLYLILTSLPLMLLAALMQERRENEDSLRESEACVKLAMESAGIGYWQVEVATEKIALSQNLERIFGLRSGTFTGTRDDFLALVHPEDREVPTRHFARCLETFDSEETEYRIIQPNGSVRWLASRGRAFADVKGKAARLLGLATDITGRRQAETLRVGQSRLLEMIAMNVALEEVLSSLTLFIESQSTGMLCSVLLLSEDGLHMQHGAAPSLPESYTKALDGAAIGPKVGSCGTAMYRAEPVIVTDILEDPLWEDYRDLAAPHGLRSCWSTPIRSSQGKVLGSFAMYYREPRGPTPEEAEFINLACHIAGIAIERAQVDQAFRESQSRVRLAMDAARIGYWEANLVADRITLSESMERIFGLSAGGFSGTAAAFYELVHPEDRNELRAKAVQCVKMLEATDAEYRIVLPGGEVRWIAGRGHAFTEPSGRVGRLLGMAIDITERKNAEAALRGALDEVQRLKEKMEAENIYLREEVSQVHRFGEVIGGSGAMLAVFKQAAQVGPTDTTVLITGETGTGKEIMARVVHARSRRAERPLVKVNCSALPAELIESELFGHEKGAFTGATARQLGRFELADGGTIFLDEVGDLPLGLQAKLLRVLQEGEFERLGSGKTIRVNVRVIAATNRDLERALHNETFRPDLYYRLNVYPIHLPPLRERKEDIELLAATFLKEASHRLGRKLEAIPERVLEAFQRYDWPGNVRELQNVIERTAVVSTGRSLELPEGWDLRTAVKEAETPAVPEAFVDGSVSRVPASFPGSTLEELERAHIIRVLMEARWRIEGPRGAAVILGLHPSTLRSRMHRLRIQRPNH